MPDAEKQQRLFHAIHDVNEDEARKLAVEFDDYARREKERRPVKKATDFIGLSRIW